MGRIRRGLTLAEILIAVAVASVTLLTLVLFTSVIHRAAREGKSQAAASTMARTELERLRMDADFLTQVRDSGGLSLERTELLDASQEGRVSPTVFTINIDLTPLSGSDRFLEAGVRVTWTEHYRQREVQLHSYLNDPTR